MWSRHICLVSNRLWSHQQDVDRASETRGRCVKIFVFVVIYGFVIACRKLNAICNLVTDCWCAHWSVILVLIFHLHGNYFWFHIAIYIRFFTSNLLCLNVYLNCLSLDNHLVSKQPQWQCHMTMPLQWGHMTEQILNLAGYGQIRTEIKTNGLAIIWAC